MRDLDMLEAAAEALQGDRERPGVVIGVGGGRRECSRMREEELLSSGEGRAAGGVKWAFRLVMQ